MSGWKTPPTEVVHVLVTRIGKTGTQVLLLRRFNTGRGDGSWDCPAGGVEPGESVAIAGVRELQEEVGLVADPRQLVEVYRQQAGTEPSVTHVFLLAPSWSGTPMNLERTRADRLEWFPLDRLPSPMLGFVVAGVREVRRLRRIEA